jgi:phage-related protein
MKKFRFVNGAARRAYMSLPRVLQKQFGVDLLAVRNGESPVTPFKDVSGSVGAGAIELIENGSSAFRAVYCAKFEKTVVVLHAFSKTAQDVDLPNMDMAEKRYKIMKAEVDAAKLAARKAARSAPKKAPDKIARRNR